MAEEKSRKQIGKRVGKTTQKATRSAGTSVRDGRRGSYNRERMAALARTADSGKVTASTRADLFRKICALIPNKVNNDTVIQAFEVLRKQQKLRRKDFTAHRAKNEEAFLRHLPVLERQRGYVEDQNSYTDMLFGDSTMQYSGCEIFATFNALKNLMGKSILSLSEIIAEYEKDGMVLSGKFGTSPKAVRDFLENKGFETEFCTDETKYDEVGVRSDSLILTMYNDKDDISKQVHTINISKDGDGFTAHNVYGNGKTVGPYPTVRQLLEHLNRGRVKGISLIGIRKGTL